MREHGRIDSAERHGNYRIDALTVRTHLPRTGCSYWVGRQRGFLPVAELFMSLRALFPVETGGGLRVCVY